VPVYLPLHFLHITVEGPELSVSGFGLSFAKIPISFGKGLFHGKLASCRIYNDPGINGEFVVVAGPAGPQDEMNTEGVVTCICVHPLVRKHLITLRRKMIWI